MCYVQPPEVWERELLRVQRDTWLSQRSAKGDTVRGGCFHFTPSLLPFCTTGLASQKDTGGRERHCPTDQHRFFSHTLSLSRAVMIIIRHSTVKCVMYQTVALSYYTFVLKAGLTQTLTAMQTHRRGGFSLLSGEFANIWQSSY